MSRAKQMLTDTTVLKAFWAGKKPLVVQELAKRFEKESALRGELLMYLQNVDNALFTAQDTKFQEMAKKHEDISKSWLNGKTSYEDYERSKSQLYGSTVDLYVSLFGIRRFNENHELISAYREIVMDLYQEVEKL